MYFNHFTADPIKALHFAILVYPTIFFYFCQNLKMVGQTSTAL